MQVNTNEVGALRVTNQHLLKELEQLTRQIQCPQETRQTRKDQNLVTREEQHLDPRREANREGETSDTREHDPNQLPGEDRNEERHVRNNKGDGPLLYQQETEERSWEQRFRDIQQEISHMKEAVKGRAPVSMDALEPRKTSKQKDRGEEKTYQGQKQDEGHQPQVRYQGPPKVVLNISRTRFKKKEAQTYRGKKTLRTREQSANG